MIDSSSSELKKRNRNKKPDEKRNKTFEARLKNARKQMNMTQAQLADQLGVETPTVSAWEQGTNFPNFETLPKLSKVLKCDLDYLFGRLDPDKLTHETQFIHDRTGLSVETITKLIESKKKADIANNPDNQMIPPGYVVGPYPVYLMYQTMSIGEILSKIVESDHASELMKDLRKLILTDRFYAFWFRHFHTDPSWINTDDSWIADSRDDYYYAQVPIYDNGLEIMTEDSYFSSVQYQTSMTFSKIIDDLTNKRDSFTLDEIKRITNTDDREALEIFKYMVNHKRVLKKKNQKRKGV